MNFIFSQSSGYKYVKLIKNPFYYDATLNANRAMVVDKLQKMIEDIAPDFFKNDRDALIQIDKVMPQRFSRNKDDLDLDVIEDFLMRILEHLEEKKYSEETIEVEEGVYELPVEKTLSQEDLESKVRNIGEFIISNNPQAFEEPKAWAVKPQFEGEEIPVYLPFNGKIVTVKVKSIENHGLNFLGDISSIYDPMHGRMVLLTEDMEFFNHSYSMVRSVGGRFPFKAEDVKKAEDILKKEA